MQTLSALAVIGSAQCFLLSASSASLNRRAEAASLIFSLIMGVEGIRLIALFLIIEFDLISSAIITQLALLRLVMAPLFLFFFRVLLVEDFAFRRKDFLHGVPYLLGLLMTAHIVEPLDSIAAEQKALLIGSGTALSFLIYGYLIKARFQITTTNPVKRKYGNRWIDGMGLYFLISGVVYLCFILSYPWLQYTLSQLILLVLLHSLVLCFLVGIAGVQSLSLRLSGQDAAHIEVKDVVDSGLVEEDSKIATEKYQGSSLTEKESEYYFGKIVGLLEADNLYLQHGLKLTDLADRTGLHVPQVSQIINQQSGMGFSEFINKYRIDEAVRCIKQKCKNSGEKPNIAEVAQVVGFNSHSSFYKYFKKYQGVTPKQYINTLESD